VTTTRRHLEQQRDEALRDLIDLEQQVSDGEIADEDARQLREQYEVEAVGALRALQDSDPDSQPGTHHSPADKTTAPHSGRYWVTSRRLLYAMGLLAAVATGVLVPQFVVDRPAGGYVTGNEVLQQPGGIVSDQRSSGTRTGDLSEVTNEELEAVVNANPEILGMRLALAERYIAENRFDLAVVHYMKALDDAPENTRALAGLSWVLLQADEVDEAQKLAAQALENDPQSVEAMWVQANILLYGLDDPRGAEELLDTLLTRQDLPPSVRRHATRLRSDADAQKGGDR
jgi:tetratricopeptide (TPR) repeat protein